MTYQPRNSPWTTNGVHSSGEGKDRLCRGGGGGGPYFLEKQKKMDRVRISPEMEQSRTEW